MRPLRLVEELRQVGRSYRHFPRVPAEMSCPICGGYVRGHQFIGADTCSIVEPFDERNQVGLQVHVRLADGGWYAWQPSLPAGAIVARVEVLGPGGMPAGEIDYAPVRAGLPEPDWHAGCSGCWRTVWHLS